MERALHWVLILTFWASFIITDGLGYSRLLAAQNYERTNRMLANVDASVFISIDCGSSEDYTDEETGFLYQTDEKFVETGDSITLPGPAQNDLNGDRYFGKRLQTLRCFPEGERNCYTLRPEQSGNNSRYLIRAFFSYGNYDGKNQTQSFDLYLGVNLWYSVDLDYGYDYEYSEIVHSPSSETIQVCLVKTGAAIPCISSLELRPLNSSLYNATSSNTLQPLLKDIRIDVGSYKSALFSRYEDDVYDRVWRHDEDVDSWHRLKSDTNSTYIDHRTTLDAYRLPAQVWGTAGVSRNVSSPLHFDYISSGFALDQNYEYYVYFHFTEIEQLPAGQKRIIDSIALNSDENILPQSQPLVLEYLKPVTISGHTTAVDNIKFSISAGADSDAPPILNAFEVYKLIKQLDSPTDPRDVTAIVDIKGAYQITWLNWQGDPCRPMQYLWVGLNCTSGTNPRITSINLRSSNLKGVINNSFSYLTELKSLDLSDNQLEGHLPEFLAELPNLEVLNLIGNKFSGPIPKALKEKAKSTLKLSVDNNPELCMKDSCNKKNSVVPLVASLSALIVILLISLGFWIFQRRHREAHANSLNGGSLRSAHRAFRYTDILNITDNFKTVIGEGGFGKVYPGILQHQVQVAVKLLSPSSIQGYREFRSEAQLLSLVHHRNLVSLIGYCDEGEIKALVYEYMPNGNLLQHLSDKNPSVLKWNERLNIAIDTANGLDYLHNGCNPPIVHRDLKTSNILLDQSKRAKIADFGLSRAFASNIDSHISTRPAGTPGYIDPEFHRTGNSNKKSDVYSFGIILLELITGQLAIARATGKNIHILNWVKPKVERGDIQSIVDPRLQGEFDTNSAWKVVEIALSCTSPIATERPDISQIFVELKECLSLEMAGITTEMTLPLDTESAPLARLSHDEYLMFLRQFHQIRLKIRR